MVASRPKLSLAARRFLDGGGIPSDPSAMIRECDTYVRKYTQVDLVKARTLAHQFVLRTRTLPPADRATALRALGWTCQVGAAYREAESAYLKARKLAGNDTDLRARIDRILIDVYMYLGDYREAVRRARIAIAAFRRLHDRDGEAKTLVNLANVFHRQDRHVDALRLYRKAARHYENTSDKLTLGVCSYNCANCLVQLLQFDEADALYRSAERLFGEVEYGLYVNEARYGRAWLDKLRGNYHLSLRALAECEEEYRKIGQPKGVTLCQLDRAEVMLELQLLSDARALAKDAEKSARKLKIQYEAAKAALFLAKAAFGLGANREAQEALRRARIGFESVKNDTMVGVSRFYDALYHDGESSLAELDSTRRLFHSAQLPLWQAVCDLTSMAIRAPRYDAATLQRLAKNPAVSSVPHLYAGWKTLLGDRSLSRHDLTGAKRNWTRAADALDKMRAKLPPVDMRQTLTEKSLDPYKRMFGHEMTRHPEAAAIWSERSKIAGIWTYDQSADLPDARRKVADRLAELAQHVTALSSSLERTRGEAAGQLWPTDNRFCRLQAEIRRDLLAAHESDFSVAGTHNTIRDTIRDASTVNPLVQFHMDDDRLVAFVHQRGVTRTHIYPDSQRMLTRFLGQWNVLLINTVARGQRQRLADRDEETRLLTMLGDWLWRPLELPLDCPQVTIIPTGEMASLPWSAMIVDGSALIDRHRFTLAPSISHFAASARFRITSRSARIFVGDTSGLKYVADELSAVSPLPAVDLDVCRPCLRENWPLSGEHLLWHYIGHAQFRGDNPFYSSLLLEDGPIFAADFRLRSCRVGLVTLAACRTGVQSSVPAYESTGLVRSLLEMGAQNVLASHWSVGDRPTADWMRTFYALLGNGHTLLDSTRLTIQRMREMYPSAGQWAAFSLFGAGRDAWDKNFFKRDMRRM